MLCFALFQVQHFTVICQKNRFKRIEWHSSAHNSTPYIRMNAFYVWIWMVLDTNARLMLYLHFYVDMGVNGLCMHRQWYFYRFVMPYASFWLISSLWLVVFYVATRAIMYVCICLHFFLESFLFFCSAYNMCVIYAMDSIHWIQLKVMFSFLCICMCVQCERFRLWREEKKNVSALFLMHLMHIECSDFQFFFLRRNLNWKKTTLARLYVWCKRQKKHHQIKAQTHFARAALKAINGIDFDGERNVSKKNATTFYIWL